MIKQLNFKEVIEKTTLSRSTIYREIAKGRFPKPFNLAKKRIAWVEEEVDLWLEERAKDRTTFDDNFYEKLEKK